VHEVRLVRLREGEHPDLVRKVIALPGVT
jgi:hypothetical protein